MSLRYFCPCSPINNLTLIAEPQSSMRPLLMTIIGPDTPQNNKTNKVDTDISLCEIITSATKLKEHIFLPMCVCRYLCR